MSDEEQLRTHLRQFENELPEIMRMNAHNYSASGASTHDALSTALHGKTAFFGCSLVVTFVKRPTPDVVPSLQAVENADGTRSSFSRKFKSSGWERIATNLGCGRLNEMRLTMFEDRVLLTFNLR